MEPGTVGPTDWFEMNRANWDARVPIHVRSRTYDIPAFVAGQETLRDYEPGEVGDVHGKTLLHLQCHLGLDTLSWARRGAIVTGLDFSRPALDVAASVAAQIGVESARFVLANVYDAATVLAGRTFDIVYSSIGSLQFLPDLDRWARVVAALVATGGCCYVTEGHPLLHFVDDDGRTLRGDYFSRDAILLNEGTYANPNAELAAPASVEWLHHTTDVVSALQHDDGRWRFPEGQPRIPLLYSLRATKDT